MNETVTVGDKEIDFKLYLELLQTSTATQPLLVFTQFVELQLIVQASYREYSDRGRRCVRTLKTLESRLRTKFSSKEDASNPLVAEGIKLTKDNVSAYIEATPEYISLSQEIDEIQETKNHIWSIKLLIDRCLDMIKIEAKKNYDDQDNLNSDLSQLISQDTY